MLNSLKIMSNDNNSLYTFEDTDDWTELFEKSTIHRPEWIRIFYLVSMFLIFVVGVIGNLITCVVIYCDKTMHTVTNCYLFNLAVSDLLVAFGILLEMNEFMKKGTGIVFANGDLVCKIHFFMVIALWNNGVLTMTALAIERYIAIMHPLMLNSTTVWKRVMKIIVPLWAVALLETLPEIWTIHLIKTPSFTVCAIVPSTYARWLNGTLGLINFVIPLAIMTFVYTTIALKVNKNSQSNKRDKVFNHRNTRSKVNKLLKLCLLATCLCIPVALTLSFLGCWLPFFTIRVIIFSSDLPNWPWYIQNWDLMVMMSSFNGWFSIVLNPMLFSLMSTKFRKALKTQWNIKIKRRRSLKQSVKALTV